MDERNEFLALAAPLPGDARAELAGIWDIGEQEAALATLISALSEAGAALADTVRGRIAVLAEAWGCWEALGGGLAACRRDAEAPETVALIEGTREGARTDAALAVRVAAGNPWPGHSFVAWFACRRCEDVLVRVHKTEPWGPDLIASAYVLVQLDSEDRWLGCVADPCGTAGPADAIEENRTLTIRGSHHTGSPALAALVSTHHRTAHARIR